MMKVIFSGGGSGGHVYPALTLAREFIKQDPRTEVCFIGSSHGLETELVPREGFQLLTLDLISLPRRIGFKLFKALYLAAQGFFKAFGLLRRLRPDLVVGTGGYVCGPVVLAAIILRIPTAIQEQNVFPGLTNRILGKFVTRVFLGYAAAGKYFSPKRVSQPGNPIRSDEFKSISRAEAEESLQLLPNHLNLLVFGGSQSARRINMTLLPLLGRLLAEFPQLQVVLMTGIKGQQQFEAAVRELNLPAGLRKRLSLVAYFYRIAAAYQAADLVVARAGALSLAEISCFGIPALLIPYPFASGNHQEYNARVLETQGAARVIREADLTPELLWENLQLLLKDAQLRQRMAQASRSLARPAAAAEIVTELRRLLAAKK